MNSIIVAIGSTNPLKISAAEKACKLLMGKVHILGVNPQSSVSDQPREDELYVGAKNRALRALESSKAAYGIGIEAGIININGRKMNTACCVIMNAEKSEHIGYSVMFEIPSEIMKMVDQGMELSRAVDRFTGKHDSGRHEGLIGILSRANFTREQMLFEAVLMALMEFTAE